MEGVICLRQVTRLLALVEQQIPFYKTSCKEKIVVGKIMTCSENDLLVGC